MLLHKLMLNMTLKKHEKYMIDSYVVFVFLNDSRRNKKDKLLPLDTFVHPCSSKQTF